MADVYIRYVRDPSLFVGDRLRLFITASFLQSLLRGNH